MSVQIAEKSPVREPSIAKYDMRDVEDLAAFTSLTPSACIERLDGYNHNEMAEAWRRANPTTPEDIRKFYESMDLYLWDLTKWNNSEEYAPYLQIADALIDKFPPSDYPRVLDYGSGVGTIALRMLAAGYEVTIADVPGPTLDYAKFRLKRHGYDFDFVNVVDDRPKLPKPFDILICFDVLEHIPKPDRFAQHLAKTLRPGGVAALVVPLYITDEWPDHLAESADSILHDLPMALDSCGLAKMDTYLYQKAGRWTTMFRKIRYWLWSLTGLYVVHTRDRNYIRQAILRNQ